jgi:hypothetical protein
LPILKDAQPKLTIDPFYNRQYFRCPNRAAIWEADQLSPFQPKLSSLNSPASTLRPQLSGLDFPASTFHSLNLMVQLLLKVLGASLAISVLLKTGGPLLPLPEDLDLVTLLIVLTPAVGLGLVLGYRHLTHPITPPQ